MKYLAIILSGCVGFISLSQEILWVRLVSFAHHSIPQTFSLVLGLFLLGIAIGAVLGRRICERDGDLVIACAWLLLVSALLDSAVPSLWSFFSGSWAEFAVMELLIVGTALLKSSLFPIVHHLGSLGSRQGLGLSVSLVYFANIVGSTLGPLFTGFFLLDHVGLEQAYILIGAGDLLLAAGCFSTTGKRTVAGLTAVAAPVVVLCLWHSDTLVPAMIGKRAKFIIENRHGIIHVLDGGNQGDVVYGGNVYDGRVNTSLKINSNGVQRVYILAALQPTPKRILVIGLSTGAWTRILSAFQGVEQIDVVEINPGYVELIRKYPEVSGILADPRIHIMFDDGRRWLKRNPTATYDLIVMNTTLHWRNYTSNLLAIEFMRQLRGHMNPGAILALNGTGSMDAFRTTAEAFPYATMFSNFILAGDHDIRLGLQGGFDRIAAMKWGDMPVFDLNDKRDVSAIRGVLGENFLSFATIQGRGDRTYEIITEQNMLTEYKYGTGVVGLGLPTGSR
jgi:spermidine synthase